MSFRAISEKSLRSYLANSRLRDFFAFSSEMTCLYAKDDNQLI